MRPCPPKNDVTKGLHCKSFINMCRCASFFRCFFRRLQPPDVMFVASNNNKSECLVCWPIDFIVQYDYQPRCTSVCWFVIVFPLRDSSEKGILSIVHHNCKYVRIATETTYQTHMVMGNMACFRLDISIYRDDIPKTNTAKERKGIVMRNANQFRKIGIC